jgi:hypothetical protein
MRCVALANRQDPDLEGVEREGEDGAHSVHGQVCPALCQQRLKGGLTASNALNRGTVRQGREGLGGYGGALEGAGGRKGGRLPA